MEFLGITHCMRIFFVLAMLSVSFSLHAKQIIGFPSASDMKWHVWVGGFKDAETPQLAFSDSGMCLRLDSAKAKGARRMVAPGPERKPVFDSPCRVRLSVSGVSGVDPGRISLGLIDSQREKFEFFPVDVVRDGDVTLLEYEIFDHAWRDGFRGCFPLKGRTQGRNRNDRLDFPVKFEVFYVVLKSGFTKGEVTFLEMSCDLNDKGDTESETALFDMPEMSDPSDWRKYGPVFWKNGHWTVTGNCPVAAIEHTRFPGLKPVGGMEEIRVRTSRACAGGVVQVQAVNPATREKRSFKMPWKTETRIPTALERGEPWQIDMLTFWVPPKSRTNVNFKVVSVTGARHVTKAEAVSVGIDTGDPLHLLDYASPDVPEAVLHNTSRKDISVKGVFRIRDFRGRGSDVPFRADLAAGVRKSVALPGKYAKGMWRVICDLSADDGTRALTALRFGVIGYGKPGLVWDPGKYRIGMCYHPLYFSEPVRTVALDALTRAGVKLARINGFQFSRCWKSENDFDWSRADKMLDLHLSRGIALNVGIYMAPEWARMPFKTKNPNHAFQMPVREGLLREYAVRIAKRYGGRIDYFELGNEWDLVPEAVLPESEAVRMHREAYSGFAECGIGKKLITNGWSTDMKYGPKGGSVRNGFQKRYMQAVNGHCAVHAVHMHGPFSSYVKSMDAHFSGRKELGLDMPWYANETAMSVTGGAEAEVALAVWRKTIYAWAKGSVDYIWYNLFAAGWVSSDNEQGYGVFTADLHPRAAYPAFAGVIETLQGLDFKAILRETESEYLFSFAGEKPGFAGIALAGWLEEREDMPQRRTVRFRTDARRAYLADMFGNRFPAEISSSGTVEMTLSQEPCALLLEGAGEAFPVEPGEQGKQ